MFVRTLRFLKLPNKGSPYSKMAPTSQNKNKVSKAKDEKGHMMEIIDIKDVPEPNNFVEIMDTNSSNDTQNRTIDQVAQASATAAIGPLLEPTESLPSTNPNGDDMEFTGHEIETLWNETLSALSGMLNDGDVHPSYREMLQMERCFVENTTNANANHNCYERWRDENFK